MARAQNAIVAPTAPGWNFCASRWPDSGWYLRATPPLIVWISLVASPAFAALAFFFAF